ncbi:hypothetical protein [Arthrobacter sp. UYCu512]|uniref:hypothetical protein n=1 Tax=Arthrobacter sp. UYCu512 TaxID=3156338 RepID=UPI003397DCA8
MELRGRCTRRLGRQRPNGDKPGIGGGKRVNAAGHPGYGTRAERRLELKALDTGGSEVFGAGDAVVFCQNIYGSDHKKSVAPERTVGTVPFNAMCKRTGQAFRAIAELVLRSRMSMSAAEGVPKGYRRMSMSAAADDGWI